MREPSVGENQRVNLTFLSSEGAHVGVALALARLYLVSSFRSCQITALQPYRTGSGATVLPRKVQPRPQLCGPLREMYFCVITRCARCAIFADCLFLLRSDKLSDFFPLCCFSSLLWHFPSSDLNLGHLHLDRCLIDMIHDRIRKNLPRSLYVEVSLDK